MRKIVKISIILAGAFFIMYSSCTKENEETTKKAENSIMFDEYEFFGGCHNQQIKKFYSIKKTKKSDYSLENFYPIFKQSIKKDFNIDTSNLPPFDSVIFVINMYLDTTETLNNIISDKELSFSVEEKTYIANLDSLIFTSLTDSCFEARLHSLKQEIAGNENLNISSKDNLLIATTVAQYSKVFWLDYYGDDISYFPWGLIGADVGGCLVGFILGGGNVGATITFGVFGSLAYAKYSNEL